MVRHYLPFSILFAFYLFKRLECGKGLFGFYFFFQFLKIKNVDVYAHLHSTRILMHIDHRVSASSMVNVRHKCICSQLTLSVEIQRFLMSLVHDICSELHCDYDTTKPKMTHIIARFGNNIQCHIRITLVSQNLMNIEFVTQTIMTSHRPL